MTVLAARFDRAIELCQRALEVDPSCEPIERQLLRLYRLDRLTCGGREQYRHYAAVMQGRPRHQPPPLARFDAPGPPGVLSPAMGG